MFISGGPSIAPRGRSRRSEPVIEVLAIPGWQTERTTLDVWTTALADATGSPPTIERESAQGSWIILGSRRIRGFAIMAGPDVEAINFEINDPNPSESTRLLEAVAASIGWEIHPDEPDDDDDD